MIKTEKIIKDCMLYSNIKSDQRIQMMNIPIVCQAYKVTAPVSSRDKTHVSILFFKNQSVAN